MISANVKKAIYLKARTNLTQKEIAKKLDVREETVSRWFKREDVKQELNKACREFLNDLLPKALQTYRDLLTSENDYVRYKTACDILNRINIETVTEEEEKIIIVDDIAKLYAKRFG